MENLWKQLTIARLNCLDDKISISIGLTKKHEFTKQELISEVEKGSTIGNYFIEVEKEYLQSFKKGKIWEQITAEETPKVEKS